MRGIKGKLCVLGLGAIAALSFFAVPAQASLHPFLKTFATGIPQGLNVELLDDSCGVAVGPGGFVYVSDYQNHQVTIFDSGGAFTGSIPSTQVENTPCAVAVDAGGVLYANNFHQAVVKSGSGAVDPDRSTGVALDPFTGSLFVTHRDHVSLYEAPVSPGDIPATVGQGSLADAYGSAVSGFAGTPGFLYVADAADDTVKVFDPATDPVNPIAEIDGSEVPLGEFRDLTDTALAVDDSNGYIFILDNLQPGFEHPIAAVYEFDAAGNYMGQLQRQVIHGGPSGLAVDNVIGSDAQGTIYVTSGNEIRVVGFAPNGEPIEEGSRVLAFCGVGKCDPTPSYVLGVEKAGSGDGVVSSSQPGVPAGILPGIDCGTICATEFDQDAQVTLTATPRPHSAFTGWTVTGQPGACPGTGTCKVTLSADREVTANFEAIPQKALMVSKNGDGAGTVTSSAAGIDCGASCIAGFDQGSTVTLTAEAAVGSEFAGWSGAGCAGINVCKVPMGSEQSVSAEFRTIPWVAPVDRESGKRTLAISVTGEGAGTITSDPAGIECGTPCSNAYAPGTKVTLTAKPDPESAFTGWSDCDSSKGTTCTVTLSSSKTVGASFAEATPLEIGGVSLNGAKATLSVVVPGKGTLSVKARQLKPVSAKARKAETVSLPLSLNKAAKKALAKKGKLKVNVTLTFKPTDGASRTLEKTITFRAKAAKKKASKK